MGEEKIGEEETPENSEKEKETSNETPEGSEEEEIPEADKQKEESESELPTDEDNDIPIRYPKEDIKDRNRAGYQRRQEAKKEKEEEIGMREEVDKLRVEVENYKETQASESLLSQFLDANPDYQEYEVKIRKYMNHPAYSQIPIGFIADGIAGQNAFIKGAEAERQAQAKADKTKSGGNAKRFATGKKDVWSMSSEEFEQEQAEVLQQSNN